MYVACSTLCFARLPLEEALKSIRQMHFAKADIAIHRDGPHWTLAEVAADVGKAAQKLRACNLPIAAFHVGRESFESESDRNLLKSVCRLARLMTVPIVTMILPPGEANPGLLKKLCAVADAEGVMLTVETHAETATGTPAGAIELCRQVPGLGLTLDPSHYTCHGTALDYDTLFPLVRHVRLRDTGTSPEQFQVCVGQGEIDYGRIITNLERRQYDRALTVDIRDIPDSPFPVDAEVRKLKYLLESLV